MGLKYNCVKLWFSEIITHKRHTITGKQAAGLYAVGMDRKGAVLYAVGMDRKGAVLYAVGV